VYYREERSSHLKGVHVRASDSLVEHFHDHVDSISLQQHPDSIQLVWERNDPAYLGSWDTPAVMSVPYCFVERSDDKGRQ
jgi:hypothetical protein